MTALRSSLRRGSMHSRARSLAVLASIIGRKHGVKVVFRSGHSASTDGKTIYLPKLSADASEDDAILLEGLLDHEAGHCRFTDFDLMTKDATQAAFRKHPMLFPLFNTLEDVWMEREQSVLYPGCFRNIKKSVDVMIDRNLYGGRLNEAKSAGDAMRGYLLHGLLARLYESERLEGFSQLHRHNLIQFVGQKLTDEIWEMATRVDTVKSTQASLDLAHQLFGLIKGALKEEDRKNPKPTERKAALQSLLEDAPQGGDIATMIEEALTKSGATDRGSNSPTQLGVINVVRATSEMPQMGFDLATLARPIALKLGVKLEALLESRVETMTSFGRSGRRLAARRVVGLTLGDLAAFTRFEEGDGMDTAVALLGDFSASMFNECPDSPEVLGSHVVAKISMLAVGNVLERFELPFMVSAYGSHIQEIKSFNDPWRSRKQLLDLGDCSGTRTAEALSFVAQQMATRQEKRQLVLLVTDGNSSSNKTVIPAMNEMARIGIEFACIFLGNQGHELQTMMNAQDYPVQRVANADDLPTAIFAAIQNAI